MAKYDEKFKLFVVQEYRAGDIGFKALGRRHGLPVGAIKDWVAQYREHGLSGLQKKYSRYDAAFKLSVLRRMWREELSRRQVAALFDLRGGHTVVTTWEQQYHAGEIGALEPRKRRRPRKMKAAPPKPPQPDTQDTRTLEDLRKENEYLRAEVAYLKKLDALIQARPPAAPKKRK
jgi:transposase